MMRADRGATCAALERFVAEYASAGLVRKATRPRRPTPFETREGNTRLDLRVPIMRSGNIPATQFVPFRNSEGRQPVIMRAAAVQGRSGRGRHGRPRGEVRPCRVLR